MSNQNFQFPPPPPPAPRSPMSEGRQPMPGFTVPPQRQEEVNSVKTKNVAFDLASLQPLLKNKFALLALGAVLLFGILLGAIFFGGSSESPKNTGLQGRIANTDITKRLERCGRSDNTAPCIIYIMNHTRVDQTAEYFFDSAAQLTGRLKQWIELDNQNYRKMRIPPGYFAEIKIPSRR